MFQDLLRKIQAGISDYNQKQPSVIGNVLTGKTWNQGIKDFGGVLIKPISDQQFNDNNNKALQGYYNRDWAANNLPQTPSNYTPKIVQYPDWMANAPAKVRVVSKPAPIAKKVITSNTPSANPGGFLESTIFPMTDEAGIPRALVAGQWAMEGGRVTDNPQHNLFGLMQGGSLIPYPNIQRNVSDYILTIQNLLKRKGVNPASVKDPGQILRILQSGDTRYEAHNPNPTTYVGDVTNTPEWRMYK